MRFTLFVDRLSASFFYPKVRSSALRRMDATACAFPYSAAAPLSSCLRLVWPWRGRSGSRIPGPVVSVVHTLIQFGCTFHEKHAVRRSDLCFNTKITVEADTPSERQIRRKRSTLKDAVPRSTSLT